MYYPPDVLLLHRLYQAAHDPLLPLEVRIFAVYLLREWLKDTDTSC